MLTWKSLGDELGIPPDVFKRAMDVFIRGGGVIIELGGPDLIRLGPGGRERCKEGREI